MKNFITNNFGPVLTIAILIGLFFPEVFLPIQGFQNFLLGLALFFGFLKIDFTEILHLKNNWGKMVLVILFYLLVLPTIFFVLFQGANLELQISVFLIVAMASAMINPVLANILKLNKLWTTTFVVLTSLLVPFTLPFLSQLFFGIDIEVSVWSMFLFLITIVAVPAVMALFVQKVLPKLSVPLNNNSGFWGVISICLFGGIIFAKNSEFLLENLFSLESLYAFIIIDLVYMSLFVIGYLLPGFLSKVRLSNALMFGNMNIGLSILLAAEFFSPQILLITFLGEFAFIANQTLFPLVLKKIDRK